MSYIRSVKPDFKVFGACYPEGHYQADSLDQDIENLKIKVDAGVTHLISQLFYDNEDFYRFLDKARAAGITVPIEAGIMPVRGAKSVRRMAERNASRIPDRLNTLLNKWGDNIQSLRAAGILYASEQIADLRGPRRGRRPPVFDEPLPPPRAVSGAMRNRCSAVRKADAYRGAAHQCVAPHVNLLAKPRVLPAADGYHERKPTKAMEGSPLCTGVRLR